MANLCVGGKQNENEGENQLIDVDQSISASKSVVAAPSDNETPTQMFKLNADCFEHFFEWLSLDELLVFRRTCKRMKAVVNYYIDYTYPKLKYLKIRKKERWLEFCRTRLNYFEWIQKLLIFDLHLSATDIDGIKYVLNQLEDLCLHEIQIDGDFYEIILKYCNRLCYLAVESTHNEPIIGTGNDWLLRQYPTLNRVQIYKGVHSSPCPELFVFLKRNPNIEHLFINSTFLYKNRDLVVQSNLKKYNFGIFIDHDDVYFDYQLTNDLHKHGFHTQLNLCDIKELSTPRKLQHFLSFPNLRSLTLVSTPHEDFSIPVVESIDKLHFYAIAGFFREDSTKLMATNFINLQSIIIKNVSLHDIRPFVCHAPKLKTIQLEGVVGEVFTDSEIQALNKEREKLARARKITIFIDEKIFLKLKWSAITNFTLIEFKRTSSLFFL